VPPLADRRPDVPQQLVRVLDIAMAADPNNRFGSAAEFAHALSQVMKLAVGVDPAVALGTAVRDLRAAQSKPQIEFSTADLDVEPIELTPKKKP